MRLLVEGVVVAGVLAVGFALILPQPLAVLMCGPLYKYCGVLCC